METDACTMKSQRPGVHARSMRLITFLIHPLIRPQVCLSLRFNVSHSARGVALGLNLR